jgi:hypothetical protein
MYWLLNKWVIGGVLILVMTATAYFKGYYKGKDSVQTEWDKAVAEQTIKTVAAERELRTKIDTVVEEKNREIARIKRTHASIVAGLRNRSERPADYNSSPETTQNCSGTGLYREDAEFLAGEAARADQYALELIACYKAYDEVFNAKGN